MPKTNYSTMLLKELKHTMTLTREPIEIDCPECKNKTMTKTQQVNGQLTYLICVLCALGLVNHIFNHIDMMMIMKIFFSLLYNIIDVGVDYCQ